MDYQSAMEFSMQLVLLLGIRLVVLKIFFFIPPFIKAERLIPSVTPSDSQIFKHAFVKCECVMLATPRFSNCKTF